MASVDGTDGIVVYDYDYNGRRIAETTNTETKRYLIDAQLPYGQVIAETDGTGSPLAVYAFGQDRISQNRSGNVSFYIADGQGSIRQLTDSDGTVTDTYDYYAFGEELSRTGTTENSFRYVGEQYDPNCGFYYLRARWMDPALGRFVSVDPFAGDPQSPMSLHRYLYANASPVSFMDPTGKISSFNELLITMSIGGTIDAILSALFSPHSLNTAAFWGDVGKGFAVGALTAPVGGIFSKVFAPLVRTIVRPLAKIIGHMEKITLVGKPALQKWVVRVSRLLVNTNKNHPPVKSTFVGRFLIRAFPKVDWEMHHVFIRQAWSKVGSEFQIYDDGLAKSL